MSKLQVTVPNTGVTLEIASSDLNAPMSFPDAEKAVEALGQGWRLPTLEELEVIYNELHQTGIGDFRGGEPDFDTYWSGTQAGDGAFEFDFDGGGWQNMESDFKLYVRPVREI